VNEPGFWAPPKAVNHPGGHYDGQHYEHDIGKEFEYWLQREFVVRKGARRP